MSQLTSSQDDKTYSPWNPNGDRRETIFTIKVKMAQQPAHLHGCTLAFLFHTTYAEKRDLYFQVVPGRTMEQALDIALCATLNQFLPDWTPRGEPESGEFFLDEHGAMWWWQPSEERSDDRHHQAELRSAAHTKGVLPPEGWICLQPHLLNS